MAERGTLTRASMIEAGLRLLDEVGLEGLTVRRLATELGVQSPALYWHVRTKQDLLDGMADAIVRAAGMGPPRPGESWPSWLDRRARAYRDSLRTHRDGARVVSIARQLSPEATALFEEELTAMVRLGFTPVLALHTITALTHYINGFVLQEQAAAGVTAPSPALTALIESDALPTLISALRAGGSPVGDAAFDHGLRMLIDGAARNLTMTGQDSAEMSNPDRSSGTGQQ